MRNAELADRIPSPISRGFDLGTHGIVSSPSERAAVWGNVCLVNKSSEIFLASRAEVFCAFRQIFGAI